MIPSIVTSRPTTASRPSNPLNPSPLAPQIRLCWPMTVPSKRLCYAMLESAFTTQRAPPASARLPIVSSADQRRSTNRPTDAEVAPSAVARCAIAMDRCLAGWLVHCSTRRHTAQLAEYRRHCGCLMHFARLANTLLQDEESARDNHVSASNFAKYSPIL